MDDLSSYMESTHNKVNSYFDKGKLVRSDEYLFDYISFREAWVNACLHNDYSTHLGPAVYLFKDHMEIFSYGSPLRVQSKEKFLVGTSKPINPELASLFMKIDNAEESGKGVNTIVENYGKDVFEFSKSDLIIKIPYNEKLLGNDTQEVIDTQTDTQIGIQYDTQEAIDTQTNKNILNNSLKKDIMVQLKKLIKDNNHITRKELSQIIGVSKATIARYLKEMNDIVYVGSSRNGYWKIID